MGLLRTHQGTHASQLLCRHPESHWYVFSEPCIKRRTLIFIFTAHMDQTFLHGTEAQKVALKTKFGMANVTHYDDVYVLNYLFL